MPPSEALISPEKGEVMQALVFTQEKILEFVPDMAAPEPGVGECLIRIKAAALNHRDVWITKGLYPGIVLPAVLGSECMGLHGDKEVVINPSMGWGSNPAIQAKGYQILGMPRNGTFAGYLTIPAEQIYDKPPHLSPEEAAAFPLTGLTAFRAVFTKGGVAAGQTVLVTGIGGGVALLAMQFAMAAGARVFVSSGSDEKIERARNLGALAGANYRQPDWVKTLQKEAGGFDLVIDGAGGEGLGQLLKGCNPGARVVVYGGGQGAVPNFSPQAIFWKQISILGTSMGSDQEFAGMLDFINRHQIRPVIDSVFSLRDGAAAFRRMADGLQFGKIILLPE